MSLSGADALAGLNDALRDVRREEDDLIARLAHGAALIAALKVHESELYRQIAAVRLDAESRATLTADLVMAEGDVTQAVTGLEERLQPALSSVAALDGEIAALATRRNAVMAERTQRQRELDSLRRRAQPVLRADPAFQAAANEAVHAASAARAAEEKAQTALLAHASRERAFRSNGLFMYLFERGFDTRAYRGNALSQWLDSMVARLIDFRAARQLFQQANDIPVRWREHADALALEARRLATVRDDIESQAVDQAGGRAARDGLVASEARRGEIDRAILVAEDRRDDAIKTWRELAQGLEPRLTATLGALSAALASAVASEMLTEARATPKGRESAALQQIDDLRQRVREESEDIQDLRAQLRTLAARRRDLEDIAYELRTQGLDDGQSRFAEDSLSGEALNAFLRGEMTAGAYWDRWRHAHSYVDIDTPLAPPRGGLGRPRGSARTEPLSPVIA